MGQPQMTGGHGGHGGPDGEGGINGSEGGHERPPQSRGWPCETFTVSKGEGCHDTLHWVASGDQTFQLTIEERWPGWMGKPRGAL